MLLVEERRQWDMLVASWMYSVLHIVILIGTYVTSTICRHRCVYSEVSASRVIKNN